MGVTLHIFFCHVVYDDLIRFISKTHTKTWSKLLFNKGTMVFYTIYAIAIFNFFFGDIIHPVPEEWIDTIKRNCESFGAGSYDNAETENFIRFNLATTIASAYMGLIFEQRYMGTRKYKEFNKTSSFTTLLRLLVCTFVGCPSLCGIILCPKTGIHWMTKLVFKTLIPISLGNLYLFAFSKYVAMKADLINTKVDLSDTTTSDEDVSPKTSKVKTK